MTQPHHHHHYYDVLPMEIWQECWKFKAYQETRNNRLASQKYMVSTCQRITKKKELEELSMKEDDRWFCDRQRLSFLENDEMYAMMNLENWDVKKWEPYSKHLQISWEKWLFYHTPIHFPAKKKIRLK